jgi:glyoxylase-like metal-dependent hydrolase (beta-lactamase superfamily II)
LYTPGHTEDSISLYDAESGYLFSGDFLYPGELYGFLPNSNLGDYLQGVRTVRQLAEGKDLRIFGAHRGGEMILESATEPVTEKSSALRTLPELGLTTLYRFQHSLEAIKAGVEKSSGVYPVIYSIDDRVVLLADPSWLQRWDPIYPELEVSDNKESSF